MGIMVDKHASPSGSALRFGRLSTIHITCIQDHIICNELFKSCALIGQSLNSWHMTSHSVFNTSDSSLSLLHTLALANCMPTKVAQSQFMHLDHNCFL